MAEVIRPTDYMWRWPASFIDIYCRHLVAAGKRDEAWAERVRGAFAEAERRPDTLLVTPLVLEVIAEKI